ncbi:ABC transporter permease [Marinisporobacter balticus]|uniref:NitT/TauT family transport system permease protein n=1 Tax=Marinisporobacter balticus TaxID=2018667 RepID=A0A4R2L495_9FIRM|nr:ABC transporter permease subunit [Marinisporobacter balticus]TCO78656.1 NitT/TauT family transport system permease protein [Marinisporobacter balticus]
MRISIIINNKFPTILSVLTLIITWKILSEIVDQEMILPSPEVTCKSLIVLLKSKTFFKVVMTTIGRGLVGFFLSCILGLIVGIFTGVSSVIEKIVAPWLIIIKSTPVMSIIILALIWFETEHVPIFVSFLVAFPIICVNVSEGMKSVDQKIIQMAQIYGVKKWRILFEIYLPSIASFFVAGICTAMGIGWKAVIAAEVLSQPKYAIGTSLYTSKIYIETASVFAWTVVAIFLSFVFEKVIRILEKKIIRWRI